MAFTMQTAKEEKAKVDFAELDLNGNNDKSNLDTNINNEAKKSAEGATDTNATIINSSGNEGFNFLEPKKDINKEAKNDPYRIMVTEKEAYQMTLKTLNALSVVSPIVSGVMQTSEGKDGKQIFEDFSKIINEVSKVAENTCEKIGVDPSKANNRWVRNVLERIYANMAQEQWIKEQNVHLEEIYHLIEKVVEFANNSAEKAYYADLDEESAIKLACVNAMTPIIAEMEEATLFRNIENDIEPIMEKLVQSCEEGVARLANDYAGADNRAKLFTLLMQEAGKLYASSWRNEVKRINNVMAKNSHNERLKQQFEEYKKNGGMPIVNIEKNFDKFFDRIVVITLKIIESRRKKK